MANSWGKCGTLSDFIFLGSKVIVDGDCSHEIKRRLLLRRKAMTNLDRIIKSKDITSPRKVPIVKAMVFLVVMNGCESWTIKKAECRRIDSVKFGAGEGFWASLGLQGDLTTQSQRKSTLDIHWKDWYWSWSSNALAICCEEPSHWKRPQCWERLMAGGEGDDRG